MRPILPRLWRAAALTALSLGLACDSGTDPEPQILMDLALDFCSNDVPVWIAYRNQGANWTTLVPNAEGTVTFSATNDVELAFVRQNGGDSDTEIIYAANTELAAISGRSCREESGSKRVNGSVSGVVGSQASQVAMSFSTVYLPANATSFSLTGLPDRPLDVLASRYNLTAGTQMADRIIIRRNQSFVNNATMPVLDFTDPTTLVPAAFGVTLSGIAAGEEAFLQNYFVSQLETMQLLASVEPVADGAHTLVGVPQQDLAGGDYHDAFVVAVDASGAVRGMDRFFLAPTNQSMTLAGPMGTVVITEVATAPYLRLSAQTVRATDYARAIRAEYVQEQAFASTRVSMTVTNGYNAPTTWDATIPDLSGVSGWQNEWGLVNGGEPIDWTVSVHGGRPELLFGAPPADGEVARFAGRTNVIDARRGDVYRFRAIARPPRLFARSR